MDNKMSITPKAKTEEMAVTNTKTKEMAVTKAADRLREFWKWRVAVWFEFYKGHPENCECADCFQRFRECSDLCPENRHGDFCDCDLCGPVSSFCTCEECIPDIFAFDKIGKVPFVPPPHSDLCTCFRCAEEDS